MRFLLLCPAALLLLAFVGERARAHPPLGPPKGDFLIGKPGGKADSPQVPPPKGDPKSDSPRAQPPKADSPLVLPPKGDFPQVQPPKGDPKSDSPRVQPPKGDSPLVLPPKGDFPQVQPPKGDPKSDSLKGLQPNDDSWKYLPVKLPPGSWDHYYRASPPRGDFPQVQPPKGDPKSDSPRAQPPKGDSPLVLPPKGDFSQVQPPKGNPKSDSPIALRPKGDSPLHLPGLSYPGSAIPLPPQHLLWTDHSSRAKPPRGVYPRVQPPKGVYPRVQPPKGDPPGERGPKSDSPQAKPPKSDSVNDALEDPPSKGDSLPGDSGKGDYLHLPSPTGRKDFVMVISNHTPAPRDPAATSSGRKVSELRRRLAEEKAKTKDFEKQSAILFSAISSAQNEVAKLKRERTASSAQIKATNRKLLETQVKLINARQRLEQCQKSSPQLPASEVDSLVDQEAKRLEEDRRKPSTELSHKKKYIRLLSDLRRRIRKEIDQINDQIEGTTRRPTRNPKEDLFPPSGY